MTAPLAGLAVVVTRPARQNDALVSQLQALGADVAAIPLLAIEPLAEPEQQAQLDLCLATLHDCQFAIFISQNAAEQALQALAQRGLHWPASLPAFAVGRATAAFLDSHSIPSSSPAVRMDSEGLLALPALQQVAGQRGVIFRGQGGRETLAHTLRERGATVDYCELYRRTLPPAAAGQWADWLAAHGRRPALVCINSSESLRHLLVIDNSAAARDNLTLLVPGERVARAAAEAGFAQLCTAQDATDSSTIATALHWYPS